MLHTAVLLAEAATEHASEPAFPPIALGLLAFGALVAGLLVTYAFRNVGNRH